MITFYTVIFIVGILYTLISFIINGVSGALHVGGDIGDAGHVHIHTHGHGHIHDIGGHHADLSNTQGITHTFLSWLGVLINPLVAVSFLTVFGGLGILGTNYFKWIMPITLIVSLSAGILVSFLLYKFIALPLYRSENSTDVTQEDLTYTKAEVISPILEAGFGKIQYTANSIRYTAPAKHYKGRAVKQGEEVIIYKIEDHVFYIIEYCDLQTIDVNQTY